MYFKDFLACHNHILACRNLCQSVCYLGLTIIYLLPKGVHSVLSPQSENERLLLDVIIYIYIINLFS